MAAPQPDFDDLKRNLLRALTGNVEQALEARADIRARQVDEARVDAASYFDQEVARLEARFGAVESDVSPVVSDDPLIRLQSAWRRAVGVLDQALAAKDAEHASAAAAAAEAAAATAAAAADDATAQRVTAEAALAAELERKDAQP